MELLLQNCFKMTTFLQTLLVHPFFLLQKYAFAFESAHTSHLLSGISNNFSLIYNITQGLRNSGTLRFSATFHNGWLYHCDTFLLVYPTSFCRSIQVPVFMPGSKSWYFKVFKGHKLKKS